MLPNYVSKLPVYPSRTKANFHVPPYNTVTRTTSADLFWGGAGGQHCLSVAYLSWSKMRGYGSTVVVQVEFEPCRPPHLSRKNNLMIRCHVLPTGDILICLSLGWAVSVVEGFVWNKRPPTRIQERCFPIMQTGGILKCLRCLGYYKNLGAAKEENGGWYHRIIRHSLHSLFQHLHTSMKIVSPIFHSSLVKSSTPSQH